MPSISDVEKISKLSAVLVIPMLAAAIYQQFGLWVLNFDDFLNSFVNSTNDYLSILAKSIAFFMCVGITALAYISLNIWLNQYKAFMYFLGLSLLSFGLLGIGSGINAVASLLNTQELNSTLLFWHLSALCWGFEIFNTGDNEH